MINRPMPYQIVDTALAVYDDIVHSGGATYQLRNDPPPATPFKADAFMVAIHPDATLVIARDLFTVDTVYEYIHRHMGLLLMPRHCLGGWFNHADDMVYLDISVAVADRSEALIVARIHNQKAIYDMARREVIDVEPDLVITGPAFKHPASSTPDGFDGVV